MTEIARGIVKRKVELFQTYEHRLARGNIASTAIGTIPAQWSAVVSIGNTSVAILNELIDPGVKLGLKRIKTELVWESTFLGSAAGSLRYYWDARSEWNDPIGTTRTTAYVNLTGTLQNPAGTAVNNTYQFIDGGYLDVGSLPDAPIRIRLNITGDAAGALTGRVKNASKVELVGIVIPGT